MDEKIIFEKYGKMFNWVINNTLALVLDNARLICCISPIVNTNKNDIYWGYNISDKSLCQQDLKKVNYYLDMNNMIDKKFTTEFEFIFSIIGFICQHYNGQPAVSFI